MLGRTAIDTSVRKSVALHAVIRAMIPMVFIFVIKLATSDSTATNTNVNFHVMMASALLALTSSENPLLVHVARQH
jgi:hypothetical protein